MIDLTLRKLVARGLTRSFPRGPEPRGMSVLGATRIMVIAVIKEISAVFADCCIPIQLSLEVEAGRNGSVVKNLGVYLTDTKRTITTPLTISLSFCRIANKPIFLGHPDGAANLMYAILAAVEQMTADEPDTDRSWDWEKIKF